MRNDEHMLPIIKLISQYGEKELESARDGQGKS
jgi:hypothetical protein